MKSEQFHDLNLKQVETGIDIAAQLSEIAETLCSIVQEFLDAVSPGSKIAWAN